MTDRFDDEAKEVKKDVSMLKDNFEKGKLVER